MQGAVGCHSVPTTGLQCRFLSAEGGLSSKMSTLPAEVNASPEQM